MSCPENPAGLYVGFVGVRPIDISTLTSNKSCNNRVEIPAGTQKQESTAGAYMRWVNHDINDTLLYTFLIYRDWSEAWLMCRTQLNWTNETTDAEVSHRTVLQMKVACARVKVIQIFKKFEWNWLWRRLL